MLAAHGDDPLDDGGGLVGRGGEAGLAQDHHVSLLGGIAQGLEEEQVFVMKGGHHGGAFDPDDPPHQSEGEDEEDQSADKGLGPEIEVQFEGAFGLRFGGGGLLVFGGEEQFVGHEINSVGKDCWGYYRPNGEEMQGGEGFLRGGAGISPCT